MMLRFLAATLFVAIPLSVSAKQRLSDKFEIQGQRLIYDTERVDGEILDDDIGSLKRLLRKHSGVREIQLNSSGGSVHAGVKMADLVIKYQLDTYVDGECTSACVDIFLAGNRRHISRGSQIGFHQRSWGAKAVQRYYHNHRDRNSWDTPFEFGSWIYGDTQNEVHQHLAYMIARGVAPGFAVETLKTGASKVWYPSQEELVAAGVLREAARPGGERPIEGGEAIGMAPVEEPLELPERKKQR